MDHSSAYGNYFFPYNAQPQRFDLFCEPFFEHSLQQPPPCFQPYGEQPSWPMQQQLPHSYWDQYAEPEQENFQSVQPWQDQFCDQLQQGMPSSELQGLTTQLAQLVAAVNKLTWKAEEENDATIKETPLEAPAFIESHTFESLTTSAIASSTPQCYQDADQLWQTQFHESEQQVAYTSDCMAYMWKVAAKFARNDSDEVVSEKILQQS
ncbi:hypothetical protein VIGAN_11147500 [Vigna angularis var. angularis]|uniref:Uncharacterized protein n=1 Tax=Vigna angularis var. angularis TaxID=157739 RepID=A0A0S3TA56_PHAAN|nr:hypothetical protein VIGAN_11147500 [Vigna angularis var. angularis]